ncbi:MAG: membrane-bound lytic murein transglycosylase D [Polaribacter sp.]|jgi:membrane-bound lytic murein transglycosylase D
MRKYIRHTIALILFCQINLVNISAAVATAPVHAKIPRYSKDVIKDRLSVIEGSVKLKFNKEVKRYINSYVKRGRHGTEQILGRSAIYFPIFEYYLELYNLPEDLKYLTIIESALITKAVSPKGAGGLWQFIRSTARSYDLKINNYVDERFDIHKSSEAAARLLSDLFVEYEDWSLVIAAYNSGTVNVNKAIRKSRSRDFWKLRKYLPKETQDYVPKFIAASYVMNYYMFYNLRPSYPDYTFQLTNPTKIYSRFSFKKIAKESGVPIKVIRMLNPGYSRQIIPPSSEGYYLVLPKVGLKESFDVEQMGLTLVD